MTHREQDRTWSLRSNPLAAALMVTLVFALATLLAQSAQAQTFTVLHNFTGGQDGGTPLAGLTMDKAGNLYGTTSFFGATGDGTVYRLKRQGSGWVFNPLYTFAGGGDGQYPQARVIFGPDGALYGTTEVGGGGTLCEGGFGCGTVFNLKPQPTACKTALCAWTETVLYSFSGGTDGSYPIAEVAFDRAGNLYGTTAEGAKSGQYCPTNGCGVVFQLTPSKAGWTESVLYSFGGIPDGYYPSAGVTFDKAGNLYGTTYDGGAKAMGIIFELIPSGSGWTEKILYNFAGNGDGGNPAAGLVLDNSGNFYGATTTGGNTLGGSAFALSPSGDNLTVLYNFYGEYDACYQMRLYVCYGPRQNLVFDAAGNLYGTTSRGGTYAFGSVFKLSPSSSGWTYTSLHDFTGGSDGAYPVSNVVLDAEGNLYGTTSRGGAGGECAPDGCGLVWEITP